MNRRTETSAEPQGRRAGPSLAAGVFARSGPSARCDEDILRQVNSLIETMNRDPGFRKAIAGFADTTVVLSATDTGRELLIALDGHGVRVGPYTGGPCDVKIQATEAVHWAVLSGEMDADAAFFLGRVRIRGPVLTAFRVKNRFLSLLQKHVADTSEAADELPPT